MQTAAEVLDKLGKHSLIGSTTRRPGYSASCIFRDASLLRERDIAWLVINEELDDVKGALAETGIDLTGVSEVEARLKGILTVLLDEIEAIYQKGRDLDRKSFAIANREHPLFGLPMQRYVGNDPSTRGLGRWRAYAEELTPSLASSRQRAASRNGHDGDDRPTIAEGSAQANGAVRSDEAVLLREGRPTNPLSKEEFTRGVLPRRREAAWLRSRSFSQAMPRCCSSREPFWTMVTG